MKESNLFWGIIDLFVNILTAIAVITIIAKTIVGVKLTFLIMIFLIWAFRPFVIKLKNYLQDNPRKKKKSSYFLKGHFKRKLLELKEGIKLPLGIAIESIGEIILIIISVLFALTITDIQTTYDLKQNLIAMFIIVFVAILIRTFGVEIRNSMYKNKTLKK